MKIKQFLLACLMSLGVVGVMQQAGKVEKVNAEDVKYCTITFGASTNSEKISSYTKTWSVTADNGDVFEVANANNYNNGWNYIKMGSKSEASVGHVATKTAIPEAISKVVVTIDAITVASINSLKLYVADDKDFTNASEVNIDKSKGAKEAVIESPANNKFYKFAADCKKSSNNGIIQISKLEFYYTVAEGSRVNVAFDSKGGSEVKGFGLNKGTAIGDAKPADPTKDGYKFEGWYTTEDCSGSAYDFLTPVTEDITLYAKWSVYESVVSFNTNGGTEINDVTITRGSKVNVPEEPTKDGYIFIGWYSDEALTTPFDFNESIDVAAKTIYAKWKVGSKYNFTKIEDFATDDWVGYKEHYVEYDNGYVYFERVCRQSSNIVNMPVTYGEKNNVAVDNDVMYVLEQKVGYIATFKLVCKQWGTKAQTITVEKSSNYGRSFTAVEGLSSDTFVIEGSFAETDKVNALNFKFLNQSSQIGIQALEITFHEPVVGAMDTVETTAGLEFDYVKRTSYVSEDFSVKADLSKVGDADSDFFGTGTISEDTYVLADEKMLLYYFDEDVEKSLKLSVVANCGADDEGVLVFVSLYYYDNGLYYNEYSKDMEVVASENGTKYEYSFYNLDSADVIGVMYYAEDEEYASTVTLIDVEVSSAPSVTFEDFDNVQMYVEYEFDVASMENCAEVGIVVTKDANFLFENGSTSLPEGVAKYVNTNKTAKFSASVDVDVTDIDEEYFVASYYKTTDGKYYFSVVSVHTVYEFIYSYFVDFDFREKDLMVLNAFYEYVIYLNADEAAE